MDQSRIKKLLVSEYKDFFDKIVIESPFAETTRDGRGIREVTLGLTSSRLIIASDVFRSPVEFTCPPQVDPSVECFELISVYPLEFVNLSIFRRRRRKTLKARLVNGRVAYYELGGICNRRKLWSRWCSQIEILRSQKENGSSLSETTAASSSSSSTLYFLSSDADFLEKSENEGNPRVCRLWAHYGGAGDGAAASWPRKDTYLGPSYGELGYGLYAPVPVRFAGASFDDLQVKYELRPVSLTPLFQKSNHSWPVAKSSKSRGAKQKDAAGDLCDVLYVHEDSHNSQKSSSATFNTSSPHRGCGDGDFVGRKSMKLLQKSSAESTHVLAPKLSRFGFGIHENCSSGLYLEPYEGDPDHLVKIKPAYKLMNPYRLIESGVAIWETSKSNKFSGNSRSEIKSLRRYALATCPHFLFGLGPWAVRPGDRVSVQRRRSSSMVAIRRQPINEEVKLPIPKKQLSTSISMTSLDPSMSSAAITTRGRIVIFWTPDYWYRPRAATAVYHELRRHLNSLRDFHSQGERGSRKPFFLRRSKNSSQGSFEGIMCSKSSCILNKIFPAIDRRRKRKDAGKSEEERSVNQLRQLLKMNMKITAWDLDSTTVAKQLTLIDKDLFLRIPAAEIEIIVYQKSSRNAPNVGAWVAFSHRTSCLTSSEILAIKKLDMRARMLARLINAANKCFAMGNFNSCRSIIAGLQSPPIYRLTSTWNYLKIHHSTRYETFAKLCKTFKNCRSEAYTRAWQKAENRPPLLPYVGHVLIRILDLDRKEQVIKAETPRRWTRKNYDCGCTYLYQASEEEKISKKQPHNLTRHTICTREKKYEPGFVQRILSNTVGKIIHGRCSSPRCQRKYDIFWAASRLMIARRYFDRWQTCVLTARIIREYEIKRKNVDWRRKRIHELNLWLSECQRHAREYDFSGHSLAWEFLLKARYREDRENFLISLKLEPPLG